MRNSQPQAAPNLQVTRASMIQRVQTQHAARRELAWEEFREFYEPVITRFAKKMGARRSDCDDIVQDVLLGFFSASAKFKYDPARGRFRGYLKTCVRNVLIKRLGQNARYSGVPLASVDEDDAAVEHVWSDVWENELLRRAIDALREQQNDSKTFQAFKKYVLEDRPANEVAQELDLSLNSVHQAKTRMSQALKAHLRQIREQRG
jgi:RNA polymerase sigma-70 factor (ECF subfamily)